jgi:hypothetical protein
MRRDRGTGDRTRRACLSIHRFLCSCQRRRVCRSVGIAIPPRISRTRSRAMISAGVVPQASSQRRKSFIRTRWVAGAFSWGSTVIEVSPSPISPTQGLARNANSPRATASYSESAVTSTECCIPLRSSHDTRQILADTLSRISSSSFLRRSGEAGFLHNSQRYQRIMLQLSARPVISPNALSGQRSLRMAATLPRRRYFTPNVPCGTR